MRRSGVPFPLEFIFRDARTKLNNAVERDRATLRAFGTDDDGTPDGSPHSGFCQSF
jgi:hypothetical protein